MAGLDLVGLTHLAARKPAELSGGQQQRVSLVRSLVMEPKVLLLDEPLSNLDARLRLEMRTELQRVQRESGVTMIFVTHDQTEALALADRIVVMRDGLVEQIGSPEEVYNKPVSRFVADFVGFENIFEVEGELIRSPHALVELGSPVHKGVKGLAWRPSQVAIGADRFRGKVLGAAFAGSVREYLLETELGLIKADQNVSEEALRIGAEICFDLPVEAAAKLSRMH